ncbi:50S ribosomal protein L31 type B subfamily [Candidatus Vidania fulgoroideae]|nr:50S ribosomal protein L31 type B subfamily [Candidatus Vidania fulgoroideae]
MKSYLTIFKDKISKKSFLIETSFKIKKKKMLNGTNSRFVEIDISSYSHPHFGIKKNKKKKKSRTINKFLKKYKRNSK